MGVREADSMAIGCDAALDDVFDDDIVAPPENMSAF
jgi:hypothetical protein